MTDGRLGFLLAAPLQFLMNLLDGHFVVGEHIENLRPGVVVEGLGLLRIGRHDLPNRHVGFEQSHLGHTSGNNHSKSTAMSILTDTKMLNSAIIFVVTVMDIAR